MRCHHGMAERLQAREKTEASLHDRRFGRLFPRNPVKLPTDPAAARELLDTLAKSMRDPTDPSGPADAGQTFFGQFIDHDITFDVTSSFGRPLMRDVPNVRTPSLDLDCVFGAGAEGTPHLYSEKRAHYLLMGNHKNPNDLARNSEGVALIGDPRNDENAIVAAIQGLFIRFANIVLYQLTKGEGVFGRASLPDESPHAAAIRLVRWHYQHMVLHEFLPAFVDEAVLDKVLHVLHHGGLPRGFRRDDAFIPAEFSVAAFRFGHGTVQSEYEIKAGDRRRLFRNSDAERGLPDFGAKRPADDIDLKLFFSTRGEPARAQKARPVGTAIAAELFDLPFVEDPADPDDKSLASRNLVRDRFTFELASGQQAAIELGYTPLDRDDATKAARLDKIPLWYYCLQEARECGGRLGEVGGTIVAGVLGRLLRDDPFSVWHQYGWEPLLANDRRSRVGDIVDFVSAERGSIHFEDELQNPRDTDFVKLDPNRH